MKFKKQSKKEKKGINKSLIRENIEAFLVAILLALFIRTFVVQAFKIPSGSMLQTLQIGDHILVNKFIYGVKIPFFKNAMIKIKEPKHGDIIVFKFPEDPSLDFIKRVIGVAGDTLEIRSKKVFINDKAIDSSYAQFIEDRIKPDRDNYGPITVPENSLFVMGDNRDSSNDSRFWGFVDLSAVKGKAFMVYWSWDRDDFGVRWDRLGNIIN